MSFLTPCPNAETLQQFLQGRLDDSACEALERHLEECASCMTLIKQLERVDTLARALQAQPDVAESALLEGIDVARQAERFKALHPGPNPPTDPYKTICPSPGCHQQDGPPERLLQDTPNGSAATPPTYKIRCPQCHNPIELASE